MVLAGFIVGFLLSFREVRALAWCLLAWGFLLADPLDPALWCGMALGAARIAWGLRSREALPG